MNINGDVLKVFEIYYSCIFIIEYKHDISLVIDVLKNEVHIFYASQCDKALKHATNE